MRSIEHFVYGDAAHVSPAELPGMRERTILMSGFSKTFSVTGWRVGYLVADARWMRETINYFHDLLYVCAPGSVSACLRGLALESLGKTFYARLAVEHEVKRRCWWRLCGRRGMTPHVPAGAYYILASAAGLPGKTAAEKARALLAKTGVASVAGSAFFAPGSGRGENLLRFCFGKKDEDLAESLPAAGGHGS